MGKSRSPGHISSGFTFVVVNLSTHLPLSRHCIENVHEPDGDDHAASDKLPDEVWEAVSGEGGRLTFSPEGASASRRRERRGKRLRRVRKRLRSLQESAYAPAHAQTSPDDVRQAMTPEEKKGHRNQTRRSPGEAPDPAAESPKEFPRSGGHVGDGGRTCARRRKGARGRRGTQIEGTRRAHRAPGLSERSGAR